MTAGDARQTLIETFRGATTRAASPAFDAARDLAADFASHQGDNLLAAIFYGSCLRTGAVDGLLDLYLIVEDYRRFDPRRWAGWGLRALPPNVFFVRRTLSGRDIQAKIAVMDRAGFSRAVSRQALDTTIWARFCQPAAVAFARDAASLDACLGWLADAATTAASVAAPLVPAAVAPLDFWRGLFRLTYGAELRTERNNRPDLIVDPEAAHFEALTEPALSAAGMAWHRENGGRIVTSLSPAQRQRAARAWRWTRLAGKLRNLARLAKAVFTFDGAVDYAVWKIERHSGHRVELTAWQRRHPILASPTVLWRLYRAGALR